MIKELKGKTMKTRELLKTIVLTAGAMTSAVRADVVSGTPFADGMVLQRDALVPVWGKAAPGEKVTVTFAGQTKTCVAGQDGAWRVNLDPMSASRENRILRIAGASNAEEIRDVLVGEVWFASGQSNMECPIWGANPRYRDGQGAMMIAKTRRPFIRYAKNARTVARAPRLGWKGVWRDYSPASFKASFKYNLSAVAFYYALELHDALGIPVGIIDSSWGGSRIEPWIPAAAFDAPPQIPEKPGKQTPTALWNGMVAAWAPFAIRGFIWYQGCSNAGQARSYCGHMHRLRDGWAKAFERPDLKLYFVQLAPFSRSWFNLQMAQRRFAEEEKNAAMVATCDLGNIWDIHPNDKETVAKRLVLQALKRDYGFTDIIADSPTLKSWKIDGDKFVLSFNDATGWYCYNADRSGPAGFEIAGPAGKFVPAKVAGVSGNGNVSGADIVVSAEGVSTPRRLRYLYSKPWIGSLYSFDSSLPLGPFEIDARDPAEGRRGGPAKLGDALKVPELAGFRTVLAADLPASRFAGYSVDRTASAGAYTRVAYALELQRRDGSVDWAVAAMDAFTADPAELGVPCVKKTFFQQRVANLVVRSNRESVKEGMMPQGGIIEFFNVNYAKGKGLKDAPGDGGRYDCNDRASSADAASDGYGCMQVHDAASGATVFAYNRFNKELADIGIGPNLEGGELDWTFMMNADDYAVRRLTVLVK